MPVKLDISGLEKFRKKVRELSGTHNYKLSELLPDEFVAKHTGYPTLQALCDAGGVNEPSDINSDAFSRFVAEHSQFSSYTEMLQAGYAEFARRKLKL